MRNIALLALSLLALAAPVGAEECVPTTSDAPAVNLGEETRYYVLENELCQPGCIFSTWVYEYKESNGIEGLQRDDLHHDDTCDGLIAPDTHAIWA